MPDWIAIAEQLKSAGVVVAADSAQAVSGGDISDAWRLRSKAGDVFLKTGPSSAVEQFAAEAEGLAEIAASGTIRVPELLANGHTDSGVFLALEWIHFEPPDAEVETRLGEQLANMHGCTQDDFGWHRNNSIGLTPQINTAGNDWLAFFRQHRLGFQLRLAAKNGFSGDLQSRGAQLMKRLPIFFDADVSDASLLHGDLWGGNWASSMGQPVIFDPAVYYGDREADIAMTRLFGGFGQSFYRAYEAHWPKRDGYRERQSIYQLYHVLNHLNLFGSGYLRRALDLMDDVL